MTIEQLIDQLTKLVEEAPHRSAMRVTFGSALEDIEGGSIGLFGGIAVLNLAPIKLDQVGGF